MNRRQLNAGWENHKTPKRYMMKCSKKTHVVQKSGKLCAGKPTFFSSKPMPTPPTSIAQSGFTISLPTKQRTSRIGAIRLCSRKVFAWRKNRIATARWRLSIAFLNLILHPTGRQNFFGFTKPDLMRRGYWRSSKNGKRRRRFTKNWWRPTDLAVRKRARAWGSCGWSISFGNRREKNSLFLSLSYAQKCRIIRL